MSRSSTTVRRCIPFVAPIAAAGLVIATTPAAFAHDQVAGGSPEPESTVSSVPESIVVENSAEPRENYNSIALSLCGDQVVSGEPSIDGSSLTLDVPSDEDLADGEYTVGYQFTSSDGHPIRGSYTFTLDTGSGEVVDCASGEEESASGDADEDGLPSWTGTALGITGVIVVAGALIMAIARFRNMNRDEDN